ncbi:ImmA/IrrE family metallo-endopeptidase [Microvirga arabica]|uniref:ImmA/IrrE family metallo-endopeptidase n=1 Tax=Microvirga arabica TaxID=1128671 RepID=UPI00193A1C0E|nr:ImmA/IrrE family metallo-endopeptidase [Microvirga arabica]MBM1170201.1 ImmA/IrrE family metallo-endopeptidase [Microvirga arabica]
MLGFIKGLLGISRPNRQEQTAIVAAVQASLESAKVPNSRRPTHQEQVTIVAAVRTSLEPEPQDAADAQGLQVRQLIKEALETTTPDSLVQSLEFVTRFRRMSVWNARMVYIQRPGARAVASEYEWVKIGRHVLPDAVPIIILWPFGPIRFVYELADTGPPLERDDPNDPFAVAGEFSPQMLATLIRGLEKQKLFRVKTEFRRHGYDSAGTAAYHGVDGRTGADAPDALGPSAVDVQTAASVVEGIRVYGVVINDRMTPRERFVTLAHELGHIFCGHLGGCQSITTKANESGWPDRTHLSLSEREIEAEAVAYLVAARAGLKPASANYLRPHAKSANLSKVDIDAVVRAAARIERLANISYGKVLFEKPRAG